MRIYFAAYPRELDYFRKVKEAKYLLVSYMELKQNCDLLDWHKERGLQDREIFLDSGAFTAHSQGKKIDIDKYIEFINRNKNFIKLYANLDVIGNWKETIKNQKYMEKKGLNPIPTFHMGENIKDLLC